TPPGSHAPRTAAFRVLRTNLQFVDVDHSSKVIVVTSSVPLEGKTTTTTNLAITLAQAGQRVALVEGDLRRPRVAEYTGLEPNVGLNTVLAGKAFSRRRPAEVGRRQAERPCQRRDPAEPLGVDPDAGHERSAGRTASAVRRARRTAWQDHPRPGCALRRSAGQRRGSATRHRAEHDARPGEEFLWVWVRLWLRGRTGRVVGLRALPHGQDIQGLPERNARKPG